MNKIPEKSPGNTGFFLPGFAVGLLKIKTMQCVQMVLTQTKNEIQDIDVKILVLQGKRETLTQQAWALEIAIDKDRYPEFPAKKTED